MQACTWHIEENVAAHRQSFCLLEVPVQTALSWAAETALESLEDQELPQQSLTTATVCTMSNSLS